LTALKTAAAAAAAVAVVVVVVVVVVGVVVLVVAIAVPCSSFALLLQQVTEFDDLLIQKLILLLIRLTLVL